MKHVLAILALVTLVACGGNSSSTPTDPPAPPNPPVATPVKSGTYQAAKIQGYRMDGPEAAPAGPVMPTTLIVDPTGPGCLVLPNYDFVKACFRVYPDGSLVLGKDAMLTHQDGTTTESPVISGRQDGNTISGTVNGNAFSVTLTDIQDQTVDLPSKAGTYVSTSSSNGVWAVIKISTARNISGYGYASQADAQAGDTTKATTFYQGTISHTGWPAPNAFNIGFGAYNNPNFSGTPISTSGYAYFTETGMVSLTAKDGSNGGQFTAVFVKQ